MSKKVTIKTHLDFLVSVPEADRERATEYIRQKIQSELSQEFGALSVKYSIGDKERVDVDGTLDKHVISGIKAKVHGIERNALNYFVYEEEHKS